MAASAFRLPELEDLLRCVLVCSFLLAFLVKPCHRAKRPLVVELLKRAAWLWELSVLEW